MNIATQRRIEKLEQAMGNGQERVTVIVRFVVAPGVECSANVAKFNDTVLRRAPNETEDEFIERAVNAAEANVGNSCARVIIFNDGDD